LDCVTLCILFTHLFVFTTHKKIFHAIPLSLGIRWSHYLSPTDSPMDSNQKLMRDQGELFSDPDRYKRLVKKLIYLTIIGPEPSSPVGSLE